MGRNRIGHKFIVLMCSFAAIFICFFIHIPTLHSEINQQQAEKNLKKLQTKILKQQEKLSKDRGELGTLERELAQTEKKVGNLNKELLATEKELTENAKEINRLQNIKNNLSKQLSKHQTVLNTQVRSEYIYGGQQKLKLLLNQQEPDKVGRDLVYYDYLHRARLDEMNQVSEIIKEVNQVQSNLLKLKNKAQETKQSIESKQKNLQREQQNRKQLLTSLNTSISTQQEKLSKLKEDENALKDLIKNIQSALVNIPGIDTDKKFIELKGKLFWPVVGRPSNKFGNKRNTSGSRLNWDGVFIPSKVGNNVRSIFHGRVAFAEWMRGLGLLLIVDHGNGYMSLYGHNQSLYKQAGDWVSAGERIATVGNSGGNGDFGLYFEIRKQGKPVNPAAWCTKAATKRQISG